jgi:hypothetical protein
LLSRDKSENRRKGLVAGRFYVAVESPWRARPMLRSRDTVLLAKRLFQASRLRSTLSGGVVHLRWQPDIQSQILAFQIRPESESEFAVCQCAPTTRRARGALFLATDGVVAGVACRLSQDDLLRNRKDFVSVCGWRKTHDHRLFAHSLLCCADNTGDIGLGYGAGAAAHAVSSARQKSKTRYL